jgi:hypothetical protein
LRPIASHAKGDRYISGGIQMIEKSSLSSAVAAACLAAAIALPDPASAQQRNTAVSRSQSNVLLDMPGLENGIEIYNYLGWSSSYSSETSTARVHHRAGFPAAGVIMQQLGKSYVWRAARLDEAWIRSTAYMVRQNSITITRPGRVGSDGYLNTVLFSSGNTHCVGFDFRRYAVGIVDGPGGEIGYRGYYCGGPDVKVGEDDIPRIVAGVYHRANGTIRRAYELDASPIPDRVRR